MKRASSLDDCSPKQFMMRLRLARLLAAGSNDIPGWRLARRVALQWLLLAPGLRIGSGVRLDRSHPELGGRLSLGAGVDIGPRVILDISGGLLLEDEATISMNALILTHNHTVVDASVSWREQSKFGTPLRLCSDSWIGGNATVLGGVAVIGKGAIVGASSVVTKEVEPFAVVIGVPASIVHYRTS